MSLLHCFHHTSILFLKCEDIVSTSFHALQKVCVLLPTLWKIKANSGFNSERHFLCVIFKCVYFVLFLQHSVIFQSIATVTAYDTCMSCFVINDEAKVMYNFHCENGIECQVAKTTNQSIFVCHEASFLFLIDFTSYQYAIQRIENELK